MDKDFEAFIYCDKALTFWEVEKSLPCVKGAFSMFIYNLSIFLTSTAFVGTNAKYGTPLSRYTVFLKTVL